MRTPLGLLLARQPQAPFSDLNCHPGLNEQDRDALTTTGAVMLQSGAFAQLLESDHGQVLASLIRDCATGWPWRSDAEVLNSDEVFLEAPEVYRLGLDANLIALAEAYLVEPCFYLGAMLKREVCDTEVAGTRQWHTDVEDQSVLRIIVYLNDVGPGGGPFEYIRRQSTSDAKNASRYRSGYVSDAWMRARVPEPEWQSCFGNAGSAVLFDGASVFHRAQLPTTHDRLTLTLTYVTRRPLQIFRPTRLSRASRTRLISSLEPRQREVIPSARVF